MRRRRPLWACWMLRAWRGASLTGSGKCAASGRSRCPWLPGSRSGSGWSPCTPSVTPAAGWRTTRVPPSLQPALRPIGLCGPRLLCRVRWARRGGRREVRVCVHARCCCPPAGAAHWPRGGPASSLPLHRWYVPLESPARVQIKVTFTLYPHL